MVLLVGTCHEIKQKSADILNAIPIALPLISRTSMLSFSHAEPRGASHSAEQASSKLEDALSVQSPVVSSARFKLVAFW
jgi:hypothetical protein